MFTFPTQNYFSSKTVSFELKWIENVKKRKKWTYKFWPREDWIWSWLRRENIKPNARIIHTKTPRSRQTGNWPELGEKNSLIDENSHKTATTFRQTRKSALQSCDDEICESQVNPSMCRLHQPNAGRNVKTFLWDVREQVIGSPFAFQNKAQNWSLKWNRAVQKGRG